MDKGFFTPEPVIFSAMGGVKTLPAETLQNFKGGFDSGADAGGERKTAGETDNSKILRVYSCEPRTICSGQN